MRSSTAKPLAALALTGIGSALVVGFRVPATAITTTGSALSTGASTAANPAGATSSGASTASSGASTASSSASTATASTGSATTQSTGNSAVTTSASAYGNGTWTGAAVGEPWGTFQVQAVISGGKLTDVVVVSEPADGHSSRINSVAVPLLTQSAIASQGASVDAVSGATWTSQSYTTSLQSALDQARAAAQKG